MINFNTDPNPKLLWQRIFNFFIVTILLIFIPVFIQLAAIQKTIVLQLVFIVMMFVSYSGLGYYAYTLLKKTSIDKVFHKPNIRNWHHIWFILRLFFIMMILEVIINTIRVALTGVATTDNQKAITNLMSHMNVTMVAMLIYAVIMAPVVEEIIFRGLVINYFFRKSWWWASIILSGILFAFPHMGLIPTNLVDGLSYLLYASMGMVLAYTYKRTGNIQDSIAIHFINNFITMIPILVIAVKYS